MRRTVAGSLLGAALTLAACGGGNGDEDKITDIVASEQIKGVVASIHQNPTSLCTEYGTEDLVAELGGQAACTTATASLSTGGKWRVSDLKVEGDTATAMVTDSTGPSKLTFTKKGDDWLVAKFGETLIEGEIEGFVAKTAKEQGVAVESVECPDDVEAKKGESFKCTVRARGGKEGDIAVQQISDDGNVRVQREEFAELLGEDGDSSGTPSGATLDVDKVEQAIAQNVSSESEGQITAALVDCPDDIPIEAGGTSTCKVTSEDGKTTAYTVTQTDDQGNVRFKGDLTPLAP